MRASITTAAILLLGSSSFAQSIQGPASARCGEQNIYRVSGPPPVGEYRWHLEWQGSDGRPHVWEGNENNPSLNLTFVTHSGPHRLWIAAAEGNSEPFAIDAAPSVKEQPTEATIGATPISPLDIPIVAASQLAFANVTSPTTRAPIPALPAPPADTPPPRANPQKPEPVTITANTSGILDLTAIGAHQEADAIPNPFRVRYQPKIQVREVTLNIGLVHVGRESRDSSVIINGELYGPGDALETLTVAAISNDFIELRGAQLIARIPVEDRPVLLRLSR